MPPGMLSQIMAMVRNAQDVPDLSESQLSSIFTMSASAATASASPAAAAAIVPSLPAKASAATAAASAAPPPQCTGIKRAADAPPVWGSLQVALWDKVKRRRISANNYKGDLDTYLRTNPHLEVYNRQDAVASRAGNQVVAGTKLAMVATSSGEAKVVVWDTSAQAKLPLEQSPTQSNLCAFLRTNPHVEVYGGQVASNRPSVLAPAPAEHKTLKESTNASSQPPAFAKPPAVAKPPLLLLANAKQLVPLAPKAVARTANAIAWKAKPSGSACVDSPATAYKVPGGPNNWGSPAAFAPSEASATPT